MVKASHIRHNDRGAALVTALLAMLILASIGMMVTYSVAEDMQVAANHYEVASCLYVSEAGLNYAMVKINVDPAWIGLPAPGRLVGDGFFTVAVSDSAAGGGLLPVGQKRINIVAVRGATQREVEVIVQ